MEQVNILKIDHIGIAVKNLEDEKLKYHKLLGAAPGGEEFIESEKVKICFFNVGEVRIELLQGTSVDSAISVFLEKKGPGIHHLAFTVTDLEATLNKLADAGFQILDPKIRHGSHGMKISFIHPKSTGGLLVELCEPPEPRK